MKTIEACILCDQPIRGFGNNAQPIANGRCCDDCNRAFVIPVRIMRLARRIDRREE